MKPSVRDMHAAMLGGSEEGLDAREVFSDLGVLIVEGRVPGGQHAAGRGYGEGPHCPKPTPSAAVARHDCDSSFLCQRAENLRKHLQLLWENNVPLCVEVLLCSDCLCGSQKAACTDVANVPSPGDLLLEQWLVTMVPVTKRCPDPPPMNARGLFQAVRSQLHFSQLSAWWSSSRGANPAHVNYRVTVPGEAFASQFRSRPLLHSFPVASVSKSTCVKVSVRTAPRTEFVPKVACALHHHEGVGAGVAAVAGVGVCVEHFPTPPADAPARCRRDDSPPSPPLSLQHPRRGRQGLTRRRDVSLTEDVSTVVDDRMQNPCTRPGKHHCRCAFEEDVPSRLKPPSPPTTTHRDQEDNRYRSKSPTFSQESCSKLLCPPEAESEAMSVFPEKQAKRVRKEPACDFKTTTGRKLNLELSRREFEEVLSVLRDRNGPSHHGSKAHSCSAGNAQSLNCRPDQKSQQMSPLVYNLEVPMQLKPTSTGKADLFLEAILRTSDNNDTKAKNNNSVLGQKSTCDEVSALSRQLSKISLGKDKTSCSVSDSCSASSGAKRKRFDFKSDEPLRNCDSVGKKNLSDPLFVFDDNLPSDSFLKSLTSRGKFTAKPDFDCLSSTIDERPLMSIPRTNKLTKRRCDTDDKVPCDEAVDNGERLATVIKDARQAIDIKGPRTRGGDTAEIAHQAIDPSRSRGGDVHDPRIPRTRGVDTVEIAQQAIDPSRTSGSDLDDLKGPRTISSDVTDSAQQAIDPSRTSGSDTDDLKGPRTVSSDSTDSSQQAIDPSRTSGSDTDDLKAPRTRPSEATDSAQQASVPTASDKARFRRSLDTAANLVFHSRTGLPLTSSPAPVRRNATCFDFDSSINCVSAIRSALFETATPPNPSEDSLSLSSDDAESEGRSPCSPKISLPPARCCWSHYTHLASSLLGTFEESVLNGRLEPVSTVQGFTASLGASGSFCPRHVTLPITVFFYTLGDNDKVSTPYLAHINLGKKGYNVPRCGTIQVTLFNPMGTVVKMFVVVYDLTDMPPNSHTFLRQRTLYMPAKADSSCQPDDFQKWLRYLIHLRFTSSKSGRIYLHTDIRMIIFRKSDLDTATAHGVEDVSYELRSFTQGPTNPKFSSRK